MFKNWTLHLFLAFCLLEIPLAAQWSMPPKTVYPYKPPFTAINPSVASDKEGNSIAVWMDASGSGSFLAAKLISKDANQLGQPKWKPTNPISASNVPADMDLNSQTLGVDENGNAMAVWTDYTYIYISTLSNGETNWSAPAIINNPAVNEIVKNPYIDVAPNGNAVAAWSSSLNPYDHQIFANIFDADCQSWRGQTNILGNGNVSFNSSRHQASIDNKGNAFVVTNATSNNVQAARYHFNAHIWVLVPSIAVNSIVFSYGAIDRSGNDIIAWIEEDHTMHVATLPSNKPFLINHRLLSTQASTNTASPIVKTDAEGGALAVWPDASGALGSARLSFPEGWVNLPLLDLMGLQPFFLSLSKNSKGEAVAAWSAFISMTQGFIQTAILVKDDHWTNLTTLTSTSQANYYPALNVTDKGDAVLLWVRDYTGCGAGIIDSSIFLNISDED